MKQSQIDYINFYYLLKGNYRKGVHALRSILADGGQAKAFAENPSAVAVVLSYDKENPDKNSEELYELLTSSNVADLASATYICSTYGVTTFAELYADEEALTQLLADSSSMNAVAASTAAIEALVADDNAFAQACESTTAMTAIASQASAMKIVAADSGAITTLSASSTGMGVVAESETAMAEIVVSTTAMNAVMANNIAVIAICSSNVAVSAIANNDAALSVAGASTDFCESAIGDGFVDELLANDIAAITCSGSASCMSAIVSDSNALDTWWSSDNFWRNAAVASPVIAANPSDYSDLVGKEKSFAIGSYGTFPFIVVAVGHNTKSTGGKAGFTFQSKNVITSEKMNSSATSSGGWGSSAMRTFLSNTLLPSFPSDVKAAIASTVVSYSKAVYETASTCTDKLWLAHVKEMAGSDSYDKGGESQFAWYENGGSVAKSALGSNAGATYWTRSIYGTAYFRFVSGSSYDYGAADNSFGVVPCFCV